MLIPILAVTLLPHFVAVLGSAEPPHQEAANDRETTKVPTRSDVEDHKQELVEEETTAHLEVDQATELKAWKFVILHHTATQSGSVESIHEAHRRRVDSSGNPWRGIGYHFVIGNGHGMSDGEVQPTFRWKEQLSGAHAGIRQYNDFGIGVCLVGNFEEAGPTSAQVDAVRRLLAELRAQFGIQNDQILKHGDLKATACPGRHFPFQEIVSRPIARRPVPNDAHHSRTSSGSTEVIKNVVSVLRTTQRNGVPRERASTP
ncbi:peptidoglycan recognition protein family protein [Thalassoglobus neptunius]|uniref:peptidoglycan recognition protein family protein n=1 Tax=Thalassoglobus neptunius TaxID=1938619 RepID=UPI0018D26008|nr:peptidoglycan recognition family protein [Thalassoglobus neptunius]